MSAPASLVSGIVFAIALCASSPGAAPPSKPGEAIPSQQFPPREARRTPGNKDSPEVMSLLRQRREVVKSELELARKYLSDPNFRTDVWAALADRLLVADLDIAETPAERIAAYRNYRDNLKTLEDQLQRVPVPFRGQGFFEYGQKLWTHSRRLQAEASLLQAELSKGEAPPSEDPPAVRAAVVAWRDAMREWAKMWMDSRIPLIPSFARELAATTLEAELAAAGDAASKIAAYQAYRDRLLAVEKDTRFAFEQRRYNVMDYLQVKEMRCEADVVLARLKSTQGKSSTVEKDPPEAKTALDDWLQTIGFEADVLKKRYDAKKAPPAESLAIDESILHQELAAASKPEERVTAYRKFLVKLKEAETALKATPGSDPLAKEIVARATYNRAAAELTVLQLAAAPNSPAAPDRDGLLKEQRDVLRIELAVRVAEWAAGSGDFQRLQESAGHLLLTDLDLAATSAERIAAYKAHVERMQTAERQSKALMDEKKGTEAWLLWTRGARLEAEVWLVRAKSNLVPEPPSSPEGKR
jgi:hypothetical protein